MAAAPHTINDVKPIFNILHREYSLSFRCCSNLWLLSYHNSMAVRRPNSCPPVEMPLQRSVNNPHLHRSSLNFKHVDYSTGIVHEHPYNCGILVHEEWSVVKILVRGRNCYYNTAL